MRSDADIEEAIDRYGDMVLRACSANLRGRHDAEDAFQDTYLKYAQHDDPFNDEEHRKAWLLRVAINICRDRLGAAASNAVPIDETYDMAGDSEDIATIERMRMREAMQLLTDDQRTAIMLSVVEGYTVPEIADAMGRPPNTIYSYIARGKKKLEEVLGND